MIVPLICFIVGSLILLYAVSFVRRPIPDTLAHHYQHRDKVIWAIAFVLLALALMLGMAGYWHLIASPVLRSTRIAMVIAALIVFFYQMIDTVSRP
ncbi:MAG TPA: hypothetical protein V6C78_00030 [Crinalium sp.]|jgi:hypothetical protein